MANDVHLANTSDAAHGDQPPRVCGRTLKYRFLFSVVSYIEVEEPGQRIDNYLGKHLRTVPKSRIYRMLRTGEVRVNGRRAKPGQRLQVGDRVRLPPVYRAPVAQRPAPSRALRALLRGSVLFDGDGLLILDKPSGLAVHGGSGLAFGLIEALRADRSEKFLELAHRLDRGSSGCLMVAKSRAALKTLHLMQRQRRIKKSYDLLVAGQWPRKLTEVDLPLHRFLTSVGERRVRVAAQGKPSRTAFAPLRDAEGATWLRAVLRSGRTHQIRVHAAASGHPLLGEDKYQTAASARCSEAVGATRLCLHASWLDFLWEGEQMRAQAPLPSPFLQVWERLCPT